MRSGWRARDERAEAISCTLEMALLNAQLNEVKSKMQQQNQWLQQVMSINEDTPYHSNLTAKAESGDAALNISGITVFRLENGRLNFQFFIDPNNRDITPHEVFKASKTALRVPTCGFNNPVVLMKFSGNYTILSGIVDARTFGENDVPLSGIAIWFTGIPQKWRGADHWKHYQVISTEQYQIQENGTAVIPSGELTTQPLSGFTLKADGWTAKLREIPTSYRTDPNITHVCDLTNESQLTGAIAQDFLDDNLFPFLDFVFGQKTYFHTIVGYKNGIELWVKTLSQSEILLKTQQGNWFLKTRRSRIDLSPLFQHFYGLAPEIKNHWRKVIYQYATSEEIMGTLRESALAASVSFAALEGLTRSIISTYSCKDEWLKGDLSLRRGKNIINAIEMVAKQEFGRQSKTFQEASKQIRTVRNATFHTDLSSDEDPFNALYRWEASQALVEILLLRQMGLEKIPNRTAHGKFDILGKDMFADVRKEELTFE